MTAHKKFYQLDQGDEVSDLYIFGDITPYPWPEHGDKSAYGIVKELRDIKSSQINVHINTPGGDAAEGLAIYNTLKNHSAKVVTICDGFACSAGSIIFMAGDERIMNEASLLLIHNAWTFARGDSNMIRKQADDLEIVTEATKKAYLSHITISEETLKEMMDNETFIPAADAVEMGFATKILETDESEGKQQSAMSYIKEQLMKAEAFKDSVDIGEIIDVDAIAEKTAALVCASIAPKDPESVEPEDDFWD